MFKVVKLLILVFYGLFFVFERYIKKNVGRKAI